MLTTRYRLAECNRCRVLGRPFFLCQTCHSKPGVYCFESRHWRSVVASKAKHEEIKWVPSRSTKCRQCSKPCGPLLAGKDSGAKDHRVLATADSLSALECDVDYRTICAACIVRGKKCCPGSVLWVERMPASKGASDSSSYPNF